MKASATIVWIFINLVCFGMCGYIYLIWSQFWLYREKPRLFSISTKTSHRNKDSTTIVETEEIPEYLSDESTLTFHTNPHVMTDQLFFNNNNERSTLDLIKGTSGNVKAKIVKRNRHGKPRFPNVAKPVIEFDSNKYICKELNDNCEYLTSEFREMLTKELHRVLMDQSNVFKSGVDSQNPYNVRYNLTVHGMYKEKDKNELLCELKKVNVRNIGVQDAPFNGEGFRKRIPTGALLNNDVFNTCALVSSAGALYGSGLGQFIDSHDVVLRFNHAPTDNFAGDVGTKTTIRVVNSQVVTKKEFRFLTSPMYKDISLLAWDPSNYTATLADWYKKPDFNMFPVYKRFLRRNPNADFHMLNPHSLWDLWDFLQTNTPYRIKKNPPSSGFVGLAILLQHCRTVHLFEYIPSARLTKRCHYYSNATDTYCTVGAWHPLAAEKSLALKMTHNSDKEIFQGGYAAIQGFPGIRC